MKKTTIFIALTCVAMTGVLAMAVDNAAKLPDVWFSYSTGDCVKVINYVDDVTYSCDNMPNRYYHAWVE